MKKLALVLFAGIFFVTANAQLQIGVKAGANFANLTGSDIDGTKTLFNFNAGAFFKVPLAHFVSFQPEVIYDGQGSKFSGGRSGDESLHLNYLNIPLLLKFAHRSGLYFETGPQIGFLLSAKDKYQGVSQDVKQDFKSADFSWVFGIGVKIPQTPVGVDFRYALGISNIEDVGQTAGTGSVRNDVFQIGLTYVLFGTSKK